MSSSSAKNIANNWLWRYPTGLVIDRSSVMPISTRRLSGISFIIWSNSDWSFTLG